MKRRLTRGLGLLLALAGGAAAGQDSGVFDGRNPDAWIIHPLTGETTEVDRGGWIEGFGQGLGDVPREAPREALVNTLPRSSVPMTAGQPTISLAGLGVAGANPAPVDARLFPPPGAYMRTIEVLIGVREDLLQAAGARLQWQVDGQPPQTLNLPARTSGPGCAELPRARGGRFEPACAAREGYIGARLHLVRDGVYTITATITRPGGGALASLTGEYTIAASGPAERDSDGDGIPDAIEAAIGLDPLRDDLGLDSDNDGWSDLDEWLRCPTPLSAEGRCAASEDPDAEPLDTDQDGWSDVDEALRGTRPDDPDPVLQPRPGESADDDNLAARRLRYKERPAAERLYEVEHLVDAALQARQGFTGTWETARAFALAGREVWSVDSRLTDDALADAGLTPADTPDSLRRSLAEAALGNGRLPLMRLPASRGNALAAIYKLPPASFPAPLDAPVPRLLHKRILPERADAGPQRFVRAVAPTIDPLAWRQAVLDWLETHLVARVTDPLTWPETRVAAAFERVLALEAQAVDAASPVLYRRQEPGLVLPFLGRMQADVLRLQDPAGVLELPQSGLAGLLLPRLRTALASNGVLATIADFIDARTAATPAGRRSDQWLAQGFERTVDPAEQGCFVLSAFEAEVTQQPDFASRCPSYYTEQDVLAWQAEDAQRRYLLRLLTVLRPEDIAAAPPSLLQRATDTDGDRLNNGSEISLLPLAQLTRPDRADSDWDAADDLADRCPLDPLDACLGFARAPQLAIGPQVTIVEGESDTLALISLQLDRLAPRDVTLTVTVAAEEGDSATPGVDFAASEFRVTIPEGEQFAVVAVPVFPDQDDEDDELFTVTLSDIANASAPVTTQRVTIGDAPPTAEAPTAVASAPAAADERASFALDGRSSADPQGGGLTYQWSQLSGPPGTLQDADQPQALFTAPEVLSAMEVRFRLQVTADDGQSSIATATTTLQPVEDPPEVQSTLELAVTQGQSVSATTSEILAKLREPDGQPMTVDDLVDPPLSGGQTTLDASGLTFTAFAGETPISPLASRFLRPAGPDAVVFIEAPQGQPQKVLRHDAASNTTATVFDETTSGTQVQVLLGSETADVAYILGQDQTLRVVLPGGTTQVRSAADTAQILAVEGRLGTAAIEPQTGDLYYCAGEFSMGEWHVVDAQDALDSATGIECEPTFTSRSVSRDGRVCLTDQQNRLFCSNGAGGIEESAVFTSQVHQILARGEELLVFVSDFFGGLRVFAVASNDSVVEYAAFESTTMETSSTVTADGSLVFVRLSGIGSGNETLQLMDWDGVAAGPPAVLSQDVPADDARFEISRGGGLLAEGDTVYWYASGSSAAYVLRQLDATAAKPVAAQVITPVTTDSNNTPNTLHWQRGRLLLARSGSEEGSCDWLLVDVADSSVSPLLQDINCFRRLLRADTLITTRFDGSQTTVRRFDGAPFTGLLRFGLDVSDTQGNSVELPVEITVTSP